MSASDFDNTVLSNRHTELVAVWQTSADQRYLLQRLPDMAWAAPQDNPYPLLSVDPAQQYQTIEGFGFALTGGSAMLLASLAASERQALLRELFSVQQGVGISVLRLSIGASDLSESCYTYDEVPPGSSDFALRYFDLNAGDQQVLPLLREILAINPQLMLVATAWSAPTWMKTNQTFIGGKLRTDCYAVYAAYLVRYLTAMRANGFTIHALTPQNEPLNQKNEPSMVMTAAEQAEFISQHLGPALQANGLQDVALWCWDHNCDVKEYPLAVFADAAARQYLRGSAWHLYGGDIAVLSEVHAAYPEMKLYFTEQWVGSDGQFSGDLLWHVRHVLIGALRNWSSMVLEWNLAADPNCCPHTPGGEARCVGALTIGAGITRNVAYYVIAHAAKFIPPGAIRIASTALEQLPNVALRTPQGEVVLLVLNDASTAQQFTLRDQGQQVVLSLPAASVASYVWASESV